MTLSFDGQREFVDKTQRENNFAHQFMNITTDNAQESKPDHINSLVESKEMHQSTDSYYHPGAMYCNDTTQAEFLMNVRMPNSESQLILNSTHMESFHNEIAMQYSNEMESRQEHTGYELNQNFAQNYSQEHYPYVNINDLQGSHYARAAGPISQNEAILDDPLSTKSKYPKRSSMSHVDPNNTALSKQNRRNRNRVSASRCRSKRKEWIQDMECKSSNTQAKIEMLRNRACMLNDAIAYGKMVYYSNDTVNLQAPKLE